MRGAIVRSGVASIVMGAALLLGVLAAAAAPHPLNGTGLPAGSTPETQPESNRPTFSVFGLVESPGRYAWRAAMTVGRAISTAGGYVDGGSPDYLQIQRLVDGRLISRTASEDDPVEPDDVIMVRGRAVERPD